MQIENYLGRPWEATGFNCWGLLREFYSREFGIELPAIGIDASAISEVAMAFAGSSVWDEFKEINFPKHGCAVAIGVGNSPHVSHCGVLLLLSDGVPRVLHNWRNCGVVCEPLERLSWQNLQVLGFYEHI